MKRTLLFSAIITFLLVAVFGWLLFEEHQSSQKLTKETQFVVRPGDQIRTVAKRLEDQGLITSQYAFLWHLAKSNDLRHVAAGTYTVMPGDTTGDIAGRLGNAEVTTTDIRITFPEGFTAKQMAARLTEFGFDGDRFLELIQNPPAEWQAHYPALADLPAGKSLEGYLFPDTYLFGPTETPESIISKMLNTFAKRVPQSLIDDAKKERGSFYDVLTLASIVEAEGKTAEDRKMIADIFWKRLRDGLPLQSDATVNYGLGTSKDQISLDDAQSDSPYNTYKFKGLPPTPIANPGLEALNAAVYPTPNPYYYFLHNLTTRETVYAKTFEEHVQNRKNNGL